DAALLRRQLAYAVPFQLSAIVEILQGNLHNYAVSHYFDAATFAIYSVGCLRIPLVDFVLNSVSNVMMVRMAEEIRDGRMRAAAGGLPPRGGDRRHRVRERRHEVAGRAAGAEPDGGEPGRGAAVAEPRGHPRRRGGRGGGGRLGQDAHGGTAAGGTDRSRRGLCRHLRGRALRLRPAEAGGAAHRAELARAVRDIPARRARRRSGGTLTRGARRRGGPGDAGGGGGAGRARG